MDDVQVLTIDTGVYDIYNENEQKEVVNIMSDFITKLHIQGDHRVDVKQESKQNKRIGMSA